MSLSMLPGQDRAKRFVQQLFRRELVPHALLFSGMTGIGKSAVAKEFAKLMNCESPREHDSCDRCGSCRKSEGAVHPDLVWVRRDGAFIKIGQIRELQEQLRFPPFEGKKRMVILEDAHYLKEEAANALLKILEEPPRDNVFILITPEPQMLLQTIVSRCCHVRFQPLEIEWIAQTLSAEQDIPWPVAQKAARLSLGSFQRARVFARENLLDQWVELTRNLEQLPGLPVSGFFKWVAHRLKSTEDLEQDLQCIKFWMRDLILSSLVAGHDPVFELDSTVLQALRRESPEDLIEIYDGLEAAAHHLKLNANRQLTLEGVCLAIRNILDGKSHRNSVPQMRQDLPL